MKISLLGFDFAIQNMPADVKEIDENAGAEGTAYTYAINYFVNHILRGTLRSVMSKKIEELTQIPRIDNPQTGKPETDVEYKNRVEAELQEKGESLYAEYKDVIVEALQSIEVDMSKTSRSTGRNYSTVAQKWKDMAQDIVVSKGDKQTSKFCKKYNVLLSSDDDEDTILGKIGLALKEIRDEAQAKAERELLNAI